MSFYVLPGMPRYGASDLKRNYQKFFVRALIGAGILHILLFGIYRITMYREMEQPVQREVRIMKYSELGPPPSITAPIERYQSRTSDKGEPVLQGRENGGEEGGGQKVRMGSEEARRQARQTISQEVAGKGLLGMLNGIGNVSTRAGAQDPEYGSGSGIDPNLDQIMSSAGGLNTQGRSGNDGGDGPVLADQGNTRGGRSENTVTINDLATEPKMSTSPVVSRKGDLMIETPADVAGRGTKSAFRSPNAIQEVLLTHVPAVRYCYERELKRTPDLAGKITVRITVGPDGIVTNAEIVNSTLNNERVERCILSRIRLWNDFKPIDASEGDVSFRQVYTFGY
jgi:TonB family protein